MIVLVTGSTDGIGKETAKILLESGHTVVVHGRNKERLSDAVRELSHRERVLGVTGDLSIQGEIKRMAEDIHSLTDRIDVLVNNAGVYRSVRVITPDGLEETFAVNHMAPFILTNLLFDLIRKSPAGRVVTVSSMIHADSLDFDNLQGEQYFDGSYAYSLSKLCNVLFAYELADRVKHLGITSNCLHPGVINTKLLRSGWGGMGSPVFRGAQTSVYLAVSPEVEKVSGKYFINKRSENSQNITYNAYVRKKLWDISLSLWKDRSLDNLFL